MKFKDLREANLSKAQINKVHDKADDLPKSDFIKRYGKEGDAVRFATATKQVKKELGIDEGLLQKFNSLFPHVPVIGKPLPSKDSYGRKDVKTIQLPVGSFKGKKEELDKEDEKSVGRVVKGLKKAVKAHQGQVDALTKDIKDEVEEGGPGSGPRHKEVTITRNGKTKTVKGVAAKIFTDAGWKLKEEVELDEVHFSNRGESPAPKGMHKLRSGRDIPSSSKVDKIHKKVVAMTDRNDHFGARIEIAKELGDKKLVQIYNALELMHDKYSGAVGNEAIELRNKFSPVLNNAIDRKFGKYADVIRDGL